MSKLRFVVPAMLAMVMVVGLGTALAADPSPDDATCAVSATVDTIMEWEGASFPALTIATHVTAQNSEVEGSAVYTLYLNGAVDITVDTVGTEAELSETGGDTLVTKYKLTSDGDGTATSGNADSSPTYALYSAVGTYAVTHVAKDGAVAITLHCQASNDSGNVADAGSYTATQTVTATWHTI